MAAVRAPVLRHLLSCQTRALRASHQRRWAQVHDVRFLATTQAPRNILEKYRDKLDRKAREEGHSDIDSLKSAYADKIHALRRETDALSAIWRLHHASNPHSLSAVIPTATFSTMEALARQNPQFVLPVPHPEQGAEMHFLQWTWDAETQSATVLFTQLAEYKARGEYAAPHTTVTHYKELAGDKGVVLMQGSVVADRGVKVDDARWLVMCLQRFYGGWDGSEGRERAEERRRLLEWFGKGDGRFSVEKLMEEAERMG
ncbi:hypothetical protein NEMBOFW57_003125 [Staphylotrichum longicolle]|uniref:Uncharacterized protein n=1 Tax=Staphylotrichum longicolle TaxID=669026 RepID=A0AAD4F5E2_9PEZI|nr:hypothetical protein NEMBOFW57_003125 [Staphylotrichum longicolle]